MKTILGLDLGPNSIGWAKVEVDDEGNYLRNIKLGSRIIPMREFNKQVQIYLICS